MSLLYNLHDLAHPKEHRMSSETLHHPVLCIKIRYSAVPAICTDTQIRSLDLAALLLMLKACIQPVNLNQCDLALDIHIDNLSNYNSIAS